MTTITLPPEIEGPLSEEARRQGTTTDLLALDKLRALVVPADASETNRVPEGKQSETLHDFLHDFSGILDSGAHVPNAAQMSMDSGRKFAEGMVKKRQEGHL